MNNSDEEIRDAIAEQAAEWLVANLSGSLDDLGRQNFLAWLRSSPIHVAEYLSITVIDGDLKAATAELDESIETLVANARQEDVRVAPAVPATAGSWLPRRAGRWAGSAMVARAVMLVLVVGFVALGAAWMWKDGFWSDTQYYHTAHGAQRLLQLADGSEIQLDTDSALTVRLSRKERLVELSRGQAYFRVAHDPRRFRVTVAGASIVAVGTEFDVDQRGSSAWITLVEGQLAVIPAGATVAKPGEPLSGVKVVNKGQQARLNAGIPVSIEAAASIPAVTAWLDRKIVVDNRPLREVAQEFNRYGKTPIEITGLQSLRISGTFNAYDTESFLAFLEQTDGLSVTRSAEVITVTPRQPASR